MAPAPTIEDVPRHLRMHRITDEELDALGSVKTGVNLTFFGIMVGGLIAFWTVLQTVRDLPAATRALFVALAVGFGVLTVFFFVWSVVEGVGSWRRIRRIRARQ